MAAAASVRLETYECADFSMTIPSGWRVETGGSGMFYSIRVYDPSEPLNQMFVLNKADLLLHGEDGKQAWQSLADMGESSAAIFAAAPVLYNPSTEGFFQQFSEYASFVSATNQASNEQVAACAKISQNFNETMDGIMSSWEARSTSQDIMSQKQSDATLGFERVYNTETGEVYQATSGFTDTYDGTLLAPVTDDSMYAQPVAGRIERLD